MKAATTAATARAVPDAASPPARGSAASSREAGDGPQLGRRRTGASEPPQHGSAAEHQQRTSGPPAGGPASERLRAERRQHRSAEAGDPETAIGEAERPAEGEVKRCTQHRTVDGEGHGHGDREGVESRLAARRAGSDRERRKGRERDGSGPELIRPLGARLAELRPVEERVAGAHLREREPVVAQGTGGELDAGHQLGRGQRRREQEAEREHARGARHRPHSDRRRLPGDAKR